MRRCQASRSIGLSSVVLVSASLFLAGCGGDSNAKIKLTRSEVRALYERGTESLKGRDFETAIASFDCVLDSDPSFDRSAYEQAPFERGRARLEAKQARLALDDFEQHIQVVMSKPDENQAKNLANAYLHRGRAYAALGKLPTAVRDYSQAIALDPSNNEAYRHRGQAYAQLSAHPPRLETPNGDNQAGSLASGPPNISQAGPERSAEDYFSEALDDFEHLLSKDSKDAETLVARGKMYVAKRRMYEAIRDFTAAIDAGDKHASAYIERGKAFAAAGTPDDVKSAISDFDKALAAEPKSAEAFYHRGLAYAEVIGSTDSMDLALGDLTEAIKYMPDASEFLLARGKIYAKTGKDEDAIADLQRAAEVNPQSGEAHFELGLALGRRGNLPDCSESLQRAVALDPAYLTKLKSRVLMGYRGTKLVVDAVLPTGQLRCSQGRIYLADSDAARRAGDRDRAQELLDRAIGYLTAAKLEDPRAPDTWYWLGEAYVRKGQTDLARECFQEVTNLDDKHFGAYLAWGKLLCDPGESQDHAPAADLLRQAIGLCGQSAEAHFLLARACLASYRRERAAKVPQLGETPADTELEEAIAHFREAARLDAGMIDKTALELAEAHRLKAQAQATRRQWNQAIATMTVALQYEPDEPRNHILRAMYRASGSNTDEARKDYEQAFRQGFIPPPVETWQGIANGLMLSKVQEDIRENQWQAARDKTRNLEKVARGMSADISNLHAGIARGYLEARNIQVAIEHCNAALGWDAANAEAYWVRGLAIALRDKPVLWEDQQGEEGDENERWLFPGWVKKSEMPDDWMPNSGEVAREIAWGIAWEKKWTEAWNIAWQADLEKAARLSPRYENELERMRGSEGRE